MKTFIDPNLLQRLRVGPLAPYLDAYLKHIELWVVIPHSRHENRNLLPVSYRDRSVWCLGESSQYGIASGLLLQ
jgi:hypothetical protein